MRLRNAPRPVHERGEARRGEQRCLGPEVDRVPDGQVERLGALAEPGTVERYEETFRGPSLPSGDVAMAEDRRLLARDLADELGLPIGNAVDFWTEASLFSRAGMTAIVYGPGDIAQAHTADEWVSLRQLGNYAESIARILQ